MKTHLNWAGQALAWSVIVAVSAALIAVLLVPRVAGATPYTVMTSSMEPDFPAGTLVVTRPVDIEDIETATVITYQLESGRPEVVTHRVIAHGVNADGDIVLQTRGDANGTPDRAWVRAVQLKGELWYSVPYLGRVNSALTGAERQLVVYAVAALLLGYALLMWIGAVRDRARRRKEPSNDATTPPAPAPA
jgi:signal peptidase I